MNHTHGSSQTSCKHQRSALRTSYGTSRAKPIPVLSERPTSWGTGRDKPQSVDIGTISLASLALSTPFLGPFDIRHG